MSTNNPSKNNGNGVSGRQSEIRESEPSIRLTLGSIKKFSRSGARGMMPGEKKRPNGSIFISKARRENVRAFLWDCRQILFRIENFPKFEILCRKWSLATVPLWPFFVLTAVLNIGNRGDDKFDIKKPQFSIKREAAA